MSMSSMEMMNDAASRGDWDSALQHARQVPRNWSPYDQLPQYKIPPHAINKVISVLPKDDRSNFFFELAGNMHPDYSHEQLKNIWENSAHDYTLENAVTNHPNWKPEGDDLNASAASDFWHSYERKVQPQHFAAIKSMYSGQPESITDHRGETGGSHDSYLSAGNLWTIDPKDKNVVPLQGPKVIDRALHAKVEHVIPHLKTHAEKVQQAIMKDDSIQKRYFNGKPYVKLYRGVGGNYGKRLYEASGFDHRDHSVEDRHLNLPVTNMASWITDQDMARRFALGRGEIKGQAPGHGVVMEAWHPVENILHSGYHKVHAGQRHAHESEQEIVVGHPGGKVKVRTKKMELQEVYKKDQKGNLTGFEDTMSPPQNVRPKPFRKSEIDDMFRDDILEDLLKAIPKPTRIGEPHPYNNTLMGARHPIVGMSWHTVPHIARRQDQEIRDRAPGFLRKLSPAHAAILKQTIDKTLASPTRHYRVGYDKDKSEQVLRSRHVLALLSNQPHVKLDLSDPAKVKLTIDRHREGIMGEKTTWTLDQAGGRHKGVSFDENDLRRSHEEEVPDGSAEDLRKIFGREEPLGHDPGRIHHVDERVRFGRLLRIAKGIFGSLEASRHSALAKGPVTTDPAEASSLGSGGSYQFSPRHDLYVHTDRLKNGLFHHVFQDKKNQEDFVHVISKHQDHELSTLATIEGRLDGKALNVSKSYTDIHHAGHGYGKLAYAAALMHHGMIRSDNQTSPHANRAWQHLRNEIPGINVRFGGGHYDDRHSAIVRGDGRQLREHLTGESKGLIPRDRLIQKQDLQKEDFGSGTKAHGWISPDGSFHPMEPDETHDKIPEAHGFVHIADAHHAGWIGVGHGGEANISGTSKTFKARTSPAMRTARQMMGQYHPGASMELHHYDDAQDPGVTDITSDVDHFARHGTIKTMMKSDSPEKKPDTIRLIHYGKVPGLKTLDPLKHGTGIPGKERARAAGPRVHLYFEGTQPESFVKQNAPHRYVAEIPAEHIYDVGQDPAGIIKRALEESKMRPINPGVLSRDDIENIVTASGYRGYHDSTHPVVPNAVTYFHPVDVKEEPEMPSKPNSFFGGEVEKSDQLEDDLNKVGKGYKKMMSNGIALLHPVRIAGQKMSADSVPFHSTIKVFHPENDKFQQADEVAQMLDLTPPDPEKTTIHPEVFKDRFGDDVHVLALGGDADKIMRHNEAFKSMGFQNKFKYRPHVTIDEPTYRKVLEQNPKTAADIEMEFDDAEIHHGHKTMKRYPRK